MGEPHYPSKGKSSRGNAQNHNSKIGKILDGLPMSIGQIQHEQIWHQWPNSMSKKDHLHYNGEPAQNIHHKMVRSMKAKFTDIVDIANGEFQGQYSPIGTVQQINTTNGQQVKGEVIEQSITPSM